MADKSTLGMLNGLAKREYYDQLNITNEFLKEELFNELSDEEFNDILLKFDTVLKRIVFSNMDMNQLEAFLTSQIKKRPDFLSESEALAVTKFWKSNKDKIHAAVAERSSWNNKLKSMKWRVDVNFGDDNQINQANAIFELDLEKKFPNVEEKKVLFEIDQEKLCHVTAQLKKIESKINSVAV